MDIYITTRSKGFPYHGYPYDFWRYEVEDMKEIFKDFEIIKLEKDPEAPGVFLKAKKPVDFKPIKLKDIELYSILTGRRIKLIITELSFSRKLKFKLHNLIELLKYFLRRLFETLILK